MSEKDNAELILDVIKAVEDRDAERLFANYHDDVEFHDASSLPYGGSYRGKAEIVARFEEDPEDTWLGTWGPLQPTDSERRMDARIPSGSGRCLNVSLCSGERVSRAFSPRIPFLKVSASSAE